MRYFFEPNTPKIPKVKPISGLKRFLVFLFLNNLNVKKE